MTKKKDPKDLKKVGRPTLYNEELANYICQKVATNDVGLARLCKMFPELPEKITINEWRWRYPDFASQYTIAKQKQAELCAEEILDIADNGSNDWMESNDPDNPGYKLNGEHYQRSRLRIDTRKWLASKLAPKIYGAPINENKDKNSESEIEKYLNSGE